MTIRGCQNRDKVCFSREALWVGAVITTYDLAMMTGMAYKKSIPVILQIICLFSNDANNRRYVVDQD